MKVAVFAYTEDAPALATGVTTYNRELVNRLCRAYPQHAFSIYLAEQNALRFEDLEFANLTKIVLRPEARGAGINGKTAAASLLAFGGFAAREVAHRLGIRVTTPARSLYESLGDLGRYDLMIYTVFGHFADFPLYVKRRFAIPCVSAIHDVRVLYERARDLKSWLTLAKARYVLSRIVRESDRALVPSRYIRDLLVSRWSSGARIDVSYVVPDLLPERVPSALLSPTVRAVMERGPYLFYPSTIVESKNHLALLEAVALLRARLPELRLILAGSHVDSELGRRMFDYIRERGLQDNVIHVGFVAETDKQALYQHAVALVVPSIGESFSLPIWEAFANACPVIASTDRDIPEQVGGAGLPCDPHSPADIAAQIERLWSDAALRSELARLGPARYEQVRRDSLFSGWEAVLQAHALSSPASGNACH